ncbi:MAG: STAS domain-containing protein [Spirochaetes bacterium]|nr:STAS domain-containing protein [Spirochaetota bacterium]
MSSRMLERAKAAAGIGTDSKAAEGHQPAPSSFEPLPNIPGALCWRPLGILDAENCGLFCDEFKAEAVPEALVLIDFSKLDGLGPAGVGLLAALQKRQRAAGGDLILFGVRPKLQRFIDSMGFGSFFSTALDQRSAVEYILGVKRDIFPLAAACPACSSHLGLKGPGRSRCRVCKAVLTVLPDGTIELG